MSKDKNETPGMSGQEDAILKLVKTVMELFVVNSQNPKLTEQELNLANGIADALRLAGYSKPTPAATDAKSDAVAFVYWIVENNWEWSVARRFRDENKIWYRVGEEGHFTYSELYDKFKQQNP